VGKNVRGKRKRREKERERESSEAGRKALSGTFFRGDAKNVPLRTNVKTRGVLQGRAALPRVYFENLE